jgi:hypothetical protein
VSGGNDQVDLGQFAVFIGSVIMDERPTPLRSPHAVSLVPLRVLRISVEDIRVFAQHWFFQLQTASRSNA